MIPLSVMGLLVQINHEHQGETITRWGSTTDSFCHLLHVYIFTENVILYKFNVDYFNT